VTPKTGHGLGSTCTVMGLFETWHCEIVEVELAPGDTLVLYTDGITEAINAGGKEFGESHLQDTVEAHSHLPGGIHSSNRCWGGPAIQQWAAG
jgi:serine phosphatase RsbU (regulator of sigma subunit)